MVIISFFVVLDEILIWHVSFIDGLVVVVRSFILYLLVLLDLRVTDWVL